MNGGHRRRETDVMDTESERHRIRHGAGNVDGPPGAADSLAGP
jgi:hypothetical protein